MRFDRPTFFTYVRRSPFGNQPMSQEQVDGLEAILALWEAEYGHHDQRFLAYILATAFHETGARMVPVREGFAKTDAAARKIVAKRKYGIPDATSNGVPLLPPTGHVYYGRGPVQLTWKDNYVKMGAFIGVDLVGNPDLALDKRIGLSILFEGMLRGFFTGKKLADYFGRDREDPEGARKIINGNDKKALIATYYLAFKDSLIEAQKAFVQGQPDDVDPASATPDGANFLTDKTMLGTVVTTGGGFAASLVGAINNPWAFGAFAVFAAIVAVGAFFAIYGRYRLRRKEGV